MFISFLLLMASSKQPQNDENTLVLFIDQSTLVSKHPQLRAQAFTLVEINNLQQEQAQKDQAATNAKAHADEKSHIEQVLGSVTAAGYQSVYDFVDKLLNVCNQQLSSCISKMLSQHGEAILNHIWAHQPDVTKHWAVGISGEILLEEGQRLTKFLQPSKATSDLLQQFLLERIMSEAEDIASTLCQLLHQIATKEKPKEKERIQKNCSLVSSAFFA
jgi:hypothetical protein